MSFSSGTYSLYATGNPVVTNTTISSTWANNTLNDIATALSTCVLKDGTQTTTASVPFAFGLSATTAITTPSTTFALVNTTATTLNFAGAATTINIGAATSATTWTGQSISITGANSTNNTTVTITNSSNAAAASHSILDVAVGGTTSTGDPQTRWTIPSGTSWYAGVDNSDSDSWKLGTGAAVGTNTLITVTSAGAVTVANAFSPGSWTSTASTGYVATSFVATATGVSGSVTGTCYYVKIGTNVIMDVASLSGTSDATSFTFTGLPAAITPARDKTLLVSTQDNGGAYGIAKMVIRSTGVVDIYKTLDAAAFTASGTKSLDGISIAYTLQ